MADINKLLGQLLGSGAAGGFAGGLAGGLASNMLTTKKGRKLGKKALKMGGIAAVGAMAYGAYQKYSASKAGSPQQNVQQTAQSTMAQPAAAQPATAQAATGQPAALMPAPAGSAFLPPQQDVAAQQKLSLILVRAMIAAARSDGQLDASESQAIFQQILKEDLTQQERDQLVEEMGKPVDIDAIVRSATSQEIAAEIYVASLLAIDVDTVEEESYLAMLAARLKLPAELVQEIHAQVNNQMVAAT